MKSRLIPLAILTGFLLASITSATPVLYGVQQTGALFTIDPSTLSTTSVGTVGSSASLIGLSTFSNSLYTFDSNTDDLLGINPADAATLATVTFSTTPSIGEGDLALNSAGGGFIESARFPTSSFDSFAFSGTSGTISPISSCATATCNSVPRTFFDGLAFSGTTLYGLQQGGAGLYTIDPTTGAFTLVGLTGISGLVPGVSFGVGALTVDPGSGVAYAVLGNGLQSDLFTINLSTGAAALDGGGNLALSGTNLANVSGLAFVDNGAASPTPEPGTVLLLGVGLAAIVAGKKKITRYAFRSRETNG